MNNTSLGSLDAVPEMVRAAGDLSLQWFRQPMQVDNKRAEGFDPVTAADRAVEDALRADLEVLSNELWGGAEILGEERGLSGQGRYRWIIDPIDGTRAFITGQPMWGTLLGLLDGGVPVGGWMYLPVLGEMYEATPDGSSVASAQLGTRPLGVRNTTRLKDATLLITHPEMFEGLEQENYERLLSTVQLSRFSGDCMNYGLIATGSADVAVESGLMPYDIAPLLPILLAAGVVVTNLEGELPVDGGFVIAAATAELHAETLSYFT